MDGASDLAAKLVPLAKTAAVKAGGRVLDGPVGLLPQAEPEPEPEPDERGRSRPGSPASPFARELDCVPVVSYQCVTKKKGVVLREKAGHGELAPDGIPVVTGGRAIRALRQVVEKGIKLAVGTAVEEAADLVGIEGFSADRVFKEVDALKEKRRVWTGVRPVLYSVPTELLPPVFVALVRRLQDLGALSDKALFEELELSEEEEKESCELQRRLFPRDKPGKPEKGWPKWGMPPTQAAAERHDSSRDKRDKQVISLSEQTNDRRFGRTSGDAKESNIREHHVRSSPFPCASSLV